MLLLLFQLLNGEIETLISIHKECKFFNQGMLWVEIFFFYFIVVYQVCILLSPMTNYL